MIKMWLIFLEILLIKSILRIITGIFLNSKARFIMLRRIFVEILQLLLLLLLISTTTFFQPLFLLPLVFLLTFLKLFIFLLFPADYLFGLVFSYFPLGERFHVILCQHSWAKQLLTCYKIIFFDVAERIKGITLVESSVNTFVSLISFIRWVVVATGNYIFLFSNLQVILGPVMIWNHSSIRVFWIDGTASRLDPHAFLFRLQRLVLQFLQSHSFI